MDHYVIWVDKHLEQFNLLWDALREFRSSLRRFGNPDDIIDSLSRLNLAARLDSLPGAEAVRVLEKATGKKIDWTSLEKWIKGAQDHGMQAAQD
ncbi:hypothetical protein COL26b_012507 [Colletotrichum chrysophilum]|uniref:uncharacterized protein n=1 Tax=Colletotrichum chrysophilum TaxID=1836956 RepID=UPI002300CAC4|nr:uncharacterized protein COL26b_012507 [Colletotrichum chrysophilum]KAJ0364479.1 hypothetical protein COL26b_012507 [Colletotrichum chrysophilum]